MIMAQIRGNIFHLNPQIMQQAEMATKPKREFATDSGGNGTSSM
jgi:hypothetical protein